MNGKEVELTAVKNNLQIDNKNNSISFTAGCNNINVPYVLASNNSIKTLEGMGTLMACDGKTMEYEGDVAKLLYNAYSCYSSARTFFIRDKKGNNLMMCEMVE